MFRFFYIVHAHRGFVSNGLKNTRLLNVCFVLLTLALTLSSFFSLRLNQARDNDYPQNTIVGRICLNLRLDWDKKKSNETKDIYTQNQLLVAALTLSFGSLYANLIRKVWVFVPTMCVSNKNHACFGGKYRKNIVTFYELSVYFFFIISQFVIWNLLVFILYGVQDSITQNGVSLAYFGYTTLFDTFHLIIIPFTILIRSRTNYPILWTNCKTKNIEFYFNLKPKIEPNLRSRNKEIEEPTSPDYLSVTGHHENRPKKVVWELPDVEC